MYTWKTFAFPSILIIALYFNLYKIPLTYNAPYKIFPWSPHPQIAKTDPEGLRLHIITAFMLLAAAYIKYLAPEKKIVDRLLFTCQLIFTAVVLPNISHLGDYHQLIATAVNGGLLLALTILYRLRNPDWYFLVLSIPVLFEFTLYLMDIGWIILAIFIPQLR